jgi:hypothetical protein
LIYSSCENNDLAIHLNLFSFIQYDESIKLKSELQNAVDRLRQKLHELEVHSQDKQNRHAIEKQQWDIQRLEFIGKINEVHCCHRQ